MKKLLLDVKNRANMSDEEFDGYMWAMDLTTKVLAEEKISFLDDFKLVFYSHMVNLAKRLKTNTPLDCGDDIPEDEVEKRALEVSEKLIAPIAKEYGTNLDRMEVILAAIQIQLAIEMQEG